MEYTHDILIPEKGGRIEELVIKSLSAKGLVCEVLDDTRIPRGDEFAYIRILKKKLLECHPRMIMPLFKAEIIARHRNELPEGIIIPIDSEKNIHMLDNKVCASELCTSLGIPQPRLYSDDEISSIKHFPVVFKRPEGLSGSSVYFPKTEKAITNLIKACQGKGHLVMDYIDGYDICVDAIRWNGYFHAECYKVILPKKKGISILRKGVVRPELVEYVKMILDAIDYKGICGVDFRIDKKTSQAYFLECNPRFSGGLRSQMDCGFDIPFLLWQMANGESPTSFKFKKRRYSLEVSDLYSLIKYRFSLG